LQLIRDQSLDKKMVELGTAPGHYLLRTSSNINRSQGGLDLVATYVNYQMNEKTHFTTVNLQSKTSHIETKRKRNKKNIHLLQLICDQSLDKKMVELGTAPGHY
jgi:23S rRNA U2552 (ribose-2'-O)-methylase RlmE/FtsJ